MRGPTDPSERRRTILIAAAVATAVAAGALVWLLAQAKPTPTAPAAQPPSLVCPDVPPSRRATLTLPVRPRVLIFGDSYTQGYGAVPETDGFAYKVGAPLGWRVTVDGVGGTGYVNPGPKNTGNYLSRLRHLKPAPYDLVFIEGGSNDSRFPLEQLQPGIDSTVRAFRAKFPTAQIALMGPLEVHGTASEVRADVNTVLTRYAASNRLVFFSPLCEKWFKVGDTKTMVNPENGHPNNAGYAEVARRFVRDVQRNIAAAAAAGTVRSATPTSTPVVAK